MKCIESICIVLTLLLGTSAQSAPPSIERRLPPPGIEIPANQRERLAVEVKALQEQLQSIQTQSRSADVEVFVKAVDFALRHNEFYHAKDVEKADRLLGSAKERLARLQSGAAPWHRQHGLVVRGYRSRIDDSVQPYGLEIPDDIDFKQQVPLYIWLHGRGDKTTDLHFIDQRQTKPGQIQPPGAIVVHPLGRQCVGYKSAGESDVWEAVADVIKNYPIDSDRIVLMGFSMGGAGAWHLGAHYADKLVAISPGAGFAETARYQNLTPDKYPPWYEQRLWGLYDVPNYTRNLFNTPVVAYSGEVDKQIQAARVMEQAYQEFGRELTHLIGPGMGHKYHPDTLQEILARMDQAVQPGLDRRPRKVTLQTRTLRYNKMFWVQVRGLQEHWRDTRVDAEILDKGRVKVSTKNVSDLRLTLQSSSEPIVIEIDGQAVQVPSITDGHAVVDLKLDSNWQLANPRQHRDGLTKRIGLHGPIDDAFMEPFLVVLPSGKSANREIQDWIDFEQQHFLDRWPALMRGDLRVKRDIDVTDDDLRTYHIVAWGTPDTNRFLKTLAASDSNIPIRWSNDAVEVGEQTFAAAHHVPVFIYPRGDRYLVVNSGLTFREGHDRTNSLQNPKLPDWAVIDIRQPPNDVTPGKVVAADFFDERWKLKKRVISPENRSENP
ncbi:MAG: prolyl oligopeptidase family serine peptidase [Pirellulaceae bacterium]